jgi:hypothetical protein
MNELRINEAPDSYLNTFSIYSKDKIVLYSFGILNITEDEEEFEDTKVVIKICISKKTRQHNDQKKKYKRAGTVNPSGAPAFTTDFSGVRVTRSLVLCVCFVDRCLSFCTFSFGHCVVWSSLIYRF